MSITSLLGESGFKSIPREWLLLRYGPTIECVPLATGQYGRWTRRCNRKLSHYIIFQLLDISGAPAGYRVPCQIAKSIASARGFTYDSYPALKDPL